MATHAWIVFGDDNAMKLTWT